MKALALVLSSVMLMALAGCASSPVYTTMPSEPAPAKPTALCAGNWVSNGSQWICQPNVSAATVYVAPTVHPWFWGLPYAYVPFGYYGGFTVCIHCGRRR
jgi:hypothetical protein